MLYVENKIPVDKMTEIKSWTTIQLKFARRLQDELVLCWYNSKTNCTKHNNGYNQSLIGVKVCVIQSLIITPQILMYY